MTNVERALLRDAEDDCGPPHGRHVLAAIAYHHPEHPDRWSERTKCRALELSKTTSGSPGWWAQKMDKIETGGRPRHLKPSRHLTPRLTLVK